MARRGAAYHPGDGRNEAEDGQNRMIARHLSSLRQKSKGRGAVRARSGFTCLFELSTLGFLGCVAGCARRRAAGPGTRSAGRGQERLPPRPAARPGRTGRPTPTVTPLQWSSPSRNRDSSSAEMIWNRGSGYSWMRAHRRSCGGSCMAVTDHSRSCPRSAGAHLFAARPPRRPGDFRTASGDRLTLGVRHLNAIPFRARQGLPAGS